MDDLIYHYDLPAEFFQEKAYYCYHLAMKRYNDGNLEMAIVWQQEAAIFSRRAREVAGIE